MLNQIKPFADDLEMRSAEVVEPSDVPREGIDIPNALSLENEAVEGTPLRDLNILDLVNNPAANGKCRIFGLGFPEESFYSFTP